MRLLVAIIPTLLLGLCSALDVQTTTLSGDTDPSRTLQAYTALRTAVPSGTVRDPPMDDPNGPQQLCDQDKIADCLAMYFDYRHPVTKDLHGDCRLSSNESDHHYDCTPPGFYLALTYTNMAQAFYDTVSAGYFVMITSYYINSTKGVHTQDGMVYHSTYSYFQNGRGCLTQDPTADCISVLIVNNNTDKLPNTTSWDDIQKQSASHLDPVTEFLLKNPGYARMIQS